MLKQNIFIFVSGLILGFIIHVGYLNMQDSPVITISESNTKLDKLDNHKDVEIEYEKEQKVHTVQDNSLFNIENFVKLTTHSNNLNLTHELVHQALLTMNELSDDEVLAVMRKLVKINEDDIPANISAKDFATELIKNAAQGILTPEDIPNQATSISYTPKEFDPNVNKLGGDPTKRVYAFFDTSNIDDQKVLVKWYKNGNKDLMLYDFYDIQKESEENYVWLEKKNDWEAGEYEVRIYSPNNNMEMISHGSFTVDESGIPQTAQNKDDS